MVDVVEGFVELAGDGGVGIGGRRAGLGLLLLGLGEVVVRLVGPRRCRFRTAVAGGMSGDRMEFRGAGSGEGGFFELDEACFLLRAEAAEEGAGGRDHHARGRLGAGRGEVDGLAVRQAEAFVVCEEDLAVEVEEVGRGDVVAMVDAGDVVEDVEHGGRGEFAVGVEVGDD